MFPLFDMLASPAGLHSFVSELTTAVKHINMSYLQDRLTAGFKRVSRSQTICRKKQRECYFLRYMLRKKPERRYIAMRFAIAAWYRSGYPDRRDYIQLHCLPVELLVSRLRPLSFWA